MEDKGNIILFVNVSKVWGGGEMWYYHMAKALKLQNHEIHIIAYPNAEFANRMKRLKFPVHEFPVRSIQLLNPFLLIKLLQLLRRINPKAVVLNSSHELKVVGLVSKWAKVPNIILRRGVSYPLKANFFNKWYLKNILTGWITISKAVQDAMLASFPILSQKRHLLLLNGIDPTVWKRTSRPTVKPYLIGMVARLSVEKGIERSIHAIHLLNSQGIKASLAIWGEGPQERQLQALIQELSLSDSVILKGFSDQLPTELQSCSLFLFTPKFGEGSSRVLLEAMALEIPCIVMDSPSMDEVIRDGETGYVVPDGDVNMLAEKIGFLLNRPSLIREMGKQGRDLVIEKFTFQRAVDQLTKWLWSK